MNLYYKLTQYISSDAYPSHMPGHKRRAAHLCDPSLIDLTEIDGFDNLHHAEGILQEAQERAAKLYGSSETHFLVNGSTAGILSAIGACAKPGGCLVMARNSHHSAFNAAGLNRLRTVYLYPERPGCTERSGNPLSPGRSSGEFLSTSVDASDVPDDIRNILDLNGPVSPSQVEEALQQQDNVCAVFLTSPTYDGVVSDIAAIAQIAHSHGTVLIVDEAHGAHFGMHGMFPESSVKLGADLVIHSLHKTLPALTQTALIHVNGPLVDRRRLRHLLSVYQTSSPSYVLMTSVDQCISLLSEKGAALFDAYARRLQHFYETTKLSHLSFLRTDDPSRILICPPAPADAGYRFDISCREAGDGYVSDNSIPGEKTGYETGGGSCREAGAEYETDCSRREAGAEYESGGSCREAGAACGAVRQGSGGMSAMQLYHTLRERFHLQPEMAGPSYVLMLSSVCDDEEGFARLSDALLTLDREFESEFLFGDSRNPAGAFSEYSRTPAGAPSEYSRTPAGVLSENLQNSTDSLYRRLPAHTGKAGDFRAEVCCTIAQALEAQTEAVSFSEAEGRISAEYLFCYPPGVPLLVPGERISAGIIRKAYEMWNGGYSLQGPEDHTLQGIHVILQQ